MQVSSSKIVETAKRFDSIAWRDPNSNGPYCALFVRHVFGLCGVRLPASSHPSDWQYSKAYPQGPGFANSLAGNEIGRQISAKSDLRPGDLVFWRFTDPHFKTPVISHVGIFAGSDHIVDRGSRAVQHRPLSTHASFVEGRRPTCIVADWQDGNAAEHAAPHKVSKIVLKDGIVSAKLRGSPVRTLKLGADSQGAITIDGKFGKAASFLIEMQDQAGHWYKGYSHDVTHHVRGGLRATPGHASHQQRSTMIGGMNRISCAVANGALAVEIDTQRGVKPRSLVMTIVEP